MQLYKSSSSWTLLYVISTVYSVALYFFFLLQIKQENLPSAGKDFVKAKYQLSYKLWWVWEIAY